MFLFLSKTDLHNVADDNNISAARKTTNKLINTLGEESELALDRFKESNMFVTLNKLQAIVAKRNSQMLDIHH